MSNIDPVKRAREKMMQKQSRAESERVGTRGRKEHKGKATSTNKHRGGRMAR